MLSRGAFAHYVFLEQLNSFSDLYTPYAALVGLSTMTILDK